jgi:hypothetical protein
MKARARYFPAVIHPRCRRPGASVGMVGGLLLLSVVLAPDASAAVGTVDLGTVGTYSVLGGQTVTNTGPSTLAGDLGVSPGTAITGFPPGQTAGATHAADAPALLAQSDLTVAYDDAAGRAPTASVAGDLVGSTDVAGVYKSSGPLALSGTLTLDGQGDPGAVFIFQVASTLTTATASYINLINGAQACHVFWQVGSSATLGTASVFRGTIMALTSVSVTTGAVVQGRALARNGSVTLDNNVFTPAECGATPPADATDTTTTASVPPGPVTVGTTVPVAVTVTGSGATPPTGSVIVTDQNGKTLGSAPVDSTGHATVPVPAGTTTGPKPITVRYTGDLTHLPSSATTTIVVRAAPRSSASTTTQAPTSRPIPPPTTSTTVANTGAAHVGDLSGLGAGLLALGFIVVWAGGRPGSARRRR